MTAALEPTKLLLYSIHCVTEKWVISTSVYEMTFFLSFFICLHLSTISIWYFTWIIEKYKRTRGQTDISYRQNIFLSLCNNVYLKRVYVTGSKQALVAFYLVWKNKDFVMFYVSSINTEDSSDIIVTEEGLWLKELDVLRWDWRGIASCKIVLNTYVFLLSHSADYAFLKDSYSNQNSKLKNMNSLMASSHGWVTGMNSSFFSVCRNFFLNRNHTSTE